MVFWSNKLYLLCSLIALFWFHESNAFVRNGISIKSFKGATVLSKRNCRSLTIRKEENNSDNSDNSDSEDVTENAIVASWNNYFEEIRLRNVGQTGLRENYDAFGYLAPLAKVIDEGTGGWGLGYADTTPYTDKTLIGLLFLSTNFFYLWAGSNLFYSNNYLLSASVEVAGLISFYYHWSQIHYGPQRDEVRLPLLIDYTTAFTTINLTVIDLVLLIVKFNDNSGCEFPVSCILYGVVGIFCLLGSWIFEYGFPYIVLHGLWHIFSSLSASIIGSQLTASACG